MPKERRIAVATDQAFRSMYWSFTTQAVLAGIRKAARVFSETFPEISLSVTPKVRYWDSSTIPQLRDFPLSVLMDLPKVSFPKVLSTLSERMEDLGFKRTLGERDRDLIIRRTRGSPKSGKFWYLMGYLDRVLTDELLIVLVENMPSDDPSELIFGFTGNCLVIERNIGGCLGLAERKGKYALFPLQYKQDLWKVILHEVGHLFGAEHTNREVASIMHPNIRGIEFDPNSREQIRDYIATL